MAHTAPPGYDSNHSAILDLIRFGPAIWSDAQLKALLFHAERSTAYGKEADQHSEIQAMEGVFSQRQLAWVRGPAGLGRSAWYKANGELAINQEEPEKTPNGVLRKSRGPGKYAVTEYAIDWLAVRARISAWKENEGSKLWTPETDRGVHEMDPRGPRNGPLKKNQDGENKGSTEIEGSTTWTHSQTLTLKSDLNSQSDCAPSVSEISIELEIACGQPPRTDGPAHEIRKVSEKLGLTLRPVARFIHEKAEDFRGRNYQYHPGLIAKSFSAEIIPWMKKNSRLIDEEQRRLRSERERFREMRQIPDPEAEQVKNEELKNEIGAAIKRKAGGTA